jgi:hypothetical protein
MPGMLGPADPHGNRKTVFGPVPTAPACPAREDYAPWWERPGTSAGPVEMRPLGRGFGGTKGPVGLRLLLDGWGD